MPAPKYPGVYIEETPSGVHAISPVATSITAFLGKAKRGPVDKPILLRSFVEFERIFGGLWKWSTLGFAVRDFFLNGGEQAVVVRLKQPGARAGAGLTSVEYLGDPHRHTGLFALEKIDLFNLLCLPPPAFDSDIPPEVWSAAADYCQRRRAFLLIDPPATWRSAQAALNGLATLGTQSENAALFFPRLIEPNPWKTNQMIDCAPGGAIAGIFARHDLQRGVWKTPAGLDAALQGAPQLTCALRDQDVATLNPRAINCLRPLPVGCVVWGGRTLQGDDNFASEWKYIAVRRLALFLETSIERGTRWTVFEPNDEPLWAQIRASVGAFLQDFFRQDAFQGTTAAQAYFVKCDGTTMTAADIAEGYVLYQVGFAPLRPAEFIILNFRQPVGSA